MKNRGQTLLVEVSLCLWRPDIGARRPVFEKQRPYLAYGWRPVSNKQRSDFFNFEAPRDRNLLLVTGPQRGARVARP